MQNKNIRQNVKVQSSPEQSFNDRVALIERITDEEPIKSICGIHFRVDYGIYSQNINEIMNEFPHSFIHSILASKGHIEICLTD